MKKRNLLTLATLILALVVPCALWLQDEPLSSEAKKMLHYRPPAVPPESNAFVALLGLNAPAGSAVLQAGEARIRQATESKSPPASAGNITLRYTYSCIKKANDHCLDEILSDAPNICRLLAENRELLERYRYIQTLPVFSNSLTSHPLLGFASADYVGLGNLSRLLSAQAILDIRAGKVDAGLDFITSDIAFYRRILTATEAGVVDKMMAVAHIRQHLILLGLLLERDMLREKTWLPLRDLLTPLENPYAYFLTADWQEHVFILQGMAHNMSRSPAELYSRVDLDGKKETQDFARIAWSYFMHAFFYKPNMTLNLESEFHTHEIALLREIPLSRLTSANPYQQIRARICTQPEDSFICKHRRNHIGEVLVGTSPPNHADYLLRIHDLDAYIRLMRALLEYKQAAEKPGADPAKILPTLGTETFNPYTEKPFEWNPEQQTLSFHPGHSRDSDQPVSVRLE
jgi:hypothetical protein